jgi:hypothetical protein
MDDKANGVVEAESEEDLSTTVPNPRPEVWKMPDPVFRKTSGRLPKSFERVFFGEAATQESSKPEDAVDTDPTPAETTPKSPALKIILVVLAVAAMVAFIAIFLTVLYFWLAYRSTTTP